MAQGEKDKVSTITSERLEPTSAASQFTTERVLTFAQVEAQQFRTAINESLGPCTDRPTKTHRRTIPLEPEMAKVLEQKLRTSNLNVTARRPETYAELIQNLLTNLKAVERDAQNSAYNALVSAATPGKHLATQEDFEMFMQAIDGLVIDLRGQVAARSTFQPVFDSPAPAQTTTGKKDSETLGLLIGVTVTTPGLDLGRFPGYHREVRREFVEFLRVSALVSLSPQGANIPDILARRWQLDQV